MADRNTKITTNQIKDGTLLPTDLDATNAPVDTYIPKYNSATGDFTWVAQTGGVGSGNAYTTSFTNGDLSSGVLTVTHNLGSTYPVVEVYDNNGKVITPDEITYVNTNSITVDLSSFGTISGTWNVRVVFGGGGASELDDLTDVGFDTGTPTDKDILVYDESTGELKFKASHKISIDGALAGNSDIDIPTEKAVKTYVDGLTGIDDFTIKRSGGNLKIADRIEQNIMLLAFYRAVDNSTSIYNLLDGFIDEYEDETGVDTGASTNEDYDSTNDLYSPTGGGAGIDENTVLLLHCNGADESTTFTDASPSEHGNATVSGNAKVDTTNKKWGTGSLELDGTGDYLSYADSADWDIVGSLVDDWTIDLWIKTNNTDTEQRIICQYQDGSNEWESRLYLKKIYMLAYIGGAMKFNFATTNNVITDTNWHHVAFIKVGAVIGIYVDGSQEAYDTVDATGTVAGSLYIGHLGTATAYFNGYMDEIRIQHSNIFEASPLSASATGYPDTITVPTGEYSSPTIDNMTLISQSQTAEASPSDARIVIFEEDVDSITLNTDIKAYITRENGTGATWEQVTLTDEGNYEGSKRVLSGVVDLDVTGMGAGTDIAYKIETLNNKDLKLHGVGVNFD